MATPRTGGFKAVVDERGSLYAVEGTIWGWVPPAGDQRTTETVVLYIDGKEAARTTIRYQSRPLIPQTGFPERYEFSVTIPPEFFGRRALVLLRTEMGFMIGHGTVSLNIDDRGNAVLAALNDAHIKELSRVPQHLKDNKPSRAYNIFLQTFCEEIFADVRASLAGARNFASVIDRNAARAVLARILPTMPEDYQYLTSAGKVLLQLDEFEDARGMFLKAIALDPVAVDARNALIKAIIGQKDWNLALSEAHQLRRIVPPATKAFAELSGTIAWLYMNLSQPERALAETTNVLRDFPDELRLLQMHGDALVRLSRYREAEATYRVAMRIDSKNALLRKRLSSALMLLGEFGEAADQDVGRMLTPTFAKLNNVPDNIPMWRGETLLKGKLLVWGEVNFGVGQNLLHASILPDLEQLGLKIVLEVEPRLVPLFRLSRPNIEVIAQVGPGEQRGDWIEDVEFHVPIGNLARYFRRTIEDFALSRPFLTFDADHAADLRRELEQKSGGKRFLVGFSWTSNNPYVGDEKTVPLQELLRALDVPGVALVNLQYGDHAQTLASASAATGVEVLEAAAIDRTDDLKGLCDLIGALDLVVCIGHTTAHLAGAIGKPNLVLVPSSPFPHWLSEGEPCVWYPQSRILRQPAEERGQWHSPLKQARRYVSLAALGLPLPEMDRNPVEEVRRHSSMGQFQGDSLAHFCRNCLEVGMAVYEYEQAGDVLRLVNKAYRESPEMQKAAGDCNLRFGTYSTALACFDAALAAGGDTLDLTMRKVDALLESYRLQEAERLLDNLLKTEPELKASRPDIVTTLGQVFARRGRYKEAIRLLEPVAKSDPANVEAVLALAFSHAESGRSLQARDVLMASLETVANPEVECALGIEIGRDGLPDAGMRILQLALERDNDPLGVFWQGQFAKQLGHKDRFQLPPCEGSYPANAADRVTVFVCMDTNYCLRYLRTLAASIARNSPGTNLHVHVVHPSEKVAEIIRVVSRLLPDGYLSYSFEAPRLGLFSQDQRRTYFASVRFVRLAEIMRKCPGTYFVMDVDNLVRAELSGCVELAENCDMMIRSRFSLRPHLSVAACGIVMSNTEAARALMDRTARYIQDAFETGHVAWFLDQIALTLAMRAAAGDRARAPRVWQLPVGLLDWDFHADSVVWTGKGRRRLRNMRYLAEYRLYTEVFDQTVAELA